MQKNHAFERFEFDELKTGLEFLESMETVRDIFRKHGMCKNDVLDLYSKITQLNMLPFDAGGSQEELQEQTQNIYEAITKASGLETETEKLSRVARKSLKKTKSPAAKLCSVNSFHGGVRVAFVHLRPSNSTTARVLQQMFTQQQSNIDVLLPEDGMTSIGACNRVVVLLSRGIFEDFDCMYMLCEACKYRKKIVPVLLESPNTAVAFSFPDEDWILQQMPYIFTHNEKLWKIHGISMADIAKAIQTVSGIIALKFPENESGRVQRTVVKTLISRKLMSQTSEVKVVEMATSEMTRWGSTDAIADTFRSGDGSSSGSNRVAPAIPTTDPVHQFRSTST
jgi:hypothetical protein